MLIVDSNVLLYALNVGANQHEAASRWLGGALAGAEAIGVPWNVKLAVLRLSTHPTVFPRPLTSEQAIDAVEEWMSAPPVIAVEPTARHLPILRGLLKEQGLGGNIVNDAHLATLALEHGASVVTFDRDFARFEGLTVVRP